MKTIGIFTFLFILYASSGFAQDTLVIDAKTKKEVVNKVATIMQEKYVFADIGEKMAKHIIKQYEKGEYNTFSEIKLFCNKLTTDLRDICNDKHIFVFYSPEEAYEVRARNKLLPEEEVNKINDQYYESDKRENFGFKKVEILNGNIGYLDLRYFSKSDTTAETLIGTMKFLSNSDAIIIDLRKNGGGEGSSLLPSYFFSSEKIYLSSCYCRDTTLNEHSWTLTNVSGKRLPDIDLYILTSSQTFSAAEDFAYTMQNLKRAIVVGEKTKGGAHPVDVLIVKGDILTQISICESYNPITKTNWEGVGVKPDAEVTSENALRIAHILALENILTKTSDIEYKMVLKSLIVKLKKQ